MWTADETIAAQVAMLRSQDEGYLVRALRIAQMYDDHRSKAGQALQAGNAFKRLTASGAMAEMVRQADDTNREKGVDEGNIPVGDSAPVSKAVSTTRQKRFSRRRRAPEQRRGERGQSAAHPALRRADGLD
ncbi:MAG: hypothetical protein ACLUI3_05635 [Christensenellales bacterium]